MRIRESMATHITGVLREEISKGVYKPGEALPTIKHLSQRFGVSLTPVNQAFQRLEKEGLVVCKVGSGTYVTDLRPITNPLRVVLCASLEMHLFGNVAARILSHLHDLRVYPSMVDAEHSNGADLLRNAIPSSRIIIMVNGSEFPFETLVEESLKGKILIGVLDWKHENDELANAAHRVLVDHVKGGALVAEHLWNKGCRRVVVLGTNTMVIEEQQCLSVTSRWGKPFEEAWLKRGGTVRVLSGRSIPGHSDPMINAEELRTIVSEEAALGSTGVFGLRDFEAWQAQDILLSDTTHRFDSIPIVGYGNTPWSQAARPPLSTIDWNLDELAHATCNLIEAAVDNTLEEPCCQYVTPLMVTRA